MIKRLIEEKIREDAGRGKVALILGPRQVGKTTLLEQLTEAGMRVLRLNCDYVTDAQRLIDRSADELASLLGGFDMVQIDEAQRVRDIGLTLKKIGDLHLSTRVVVTGSSSLELANGIYDSAVGRVLEYRLFPFAMEELAATSSTIEQDRMLPQRLIYGLYPEVVNDPAHAEETVMMLANNYLYRDMLAYQGIKKPDLVVQLLQALALQLGSEVSYNEIGNMLHVTSATVESYVDLLEKCFIIFRLPAFSRNPRKEISKGRKVYFYDNGIRNALIDAFKPLEMRQDVGALWENFVIAERVKRNAYHGHRAKLYFWRTYGQSEVDLVEESGGELHAYEMKWNRASRARLPRAFAASYPEASFDVITPDSYWAFVMG